MLWLLGFGIGRVDAGESPPVPYRGAPIIPWAKSVGEHRFRSSRSYDDTLEYYRKAFTGRDSLPREKIVNNPGFVRALHLKNPETRGTWEGLNVYEHRGNTYVFVVFRDAELKKILEERAKEKEKEKKKTATTKDPRR